MTSQPYIHLKYQAQEEKDIEGFLEFVKWYGDNYSVTAATAYGSAVDVVSANATGGTVLTEIKGRKGSRVNDPDIMIEPHKLDCLERYWKEKGMWTFYLNLYEGTDIAYLFFIPGIAHLRKEFRFKKDEHIRFDKGVKIEDRYYIPAEYGYKIDLKTGDIISRAQENIKVPAPKAYDIPFGNGEITMTQIDQADER